METGLKMRKQVRQWTGIPISVGIAPSKALAKIANKIAKKFSNKTEHQRYYFVGRALKCLSIEKQFI